MDNLTTGVPGLDAVLDGGVARGSQVLVVGPTGAGKTILAAQMVFHQGHQGKRALWLTVLTEASSKLIEHLDTLDYFDAGLLGNGVQILNIQRMLEERGLDEAIGEILHTVMDHKVELLLLESVHSLYTLMKDESAVQSFIFRLGSSMFQVGCTTIMVTDKEPSEGGESSLEAVISDVTLRLKVSTVGKRELRELRVIKERGFSPLTGWHSFDITSAGIRVYPRIESRAVIEEMPRTQGRLGWGIPRLDELTGGGIRPHDATLVLGTTGIGKTTLALHFLADGVAQGESCLYLTFNETASRLLEKAEEFGMPLARAVEAGTLHIAYIPPAALDVDRVLNTVIEHVGSRGAARLVIDTLNPIERVATREGRYPEVLPALLNVLQATGVSVLILRELVRLVGQSFELAETPETYWTPFDNILLLRPVELSGRVSRVLSVLKMRRSDHDERFYGFDIGGRGLEIGDALEGLHGLLTGLPHKAEG
ncbi:MAG: hypothetical protein M3Q29_01245 [Chloroflexota bacterium]|nr:hypothetical protein [Chloroflexota bacterium]